MSCEWQLLLLTWWFCKHWLLPCWLCKLNIADTAVEDGWHVCFCSRPVWVHTTKILFQDMRSTQVSNLQMQKQQRQQDTLALDSTGCFPEANSLFLQCSASPAKDSAILPDQKLGKVPGNWAGVPAGFLQYPPWHIISTPVQIFWLDITTFRSYEAIFWIHADQCRYHKDSKIIT